MHVVVHVPHMSFVHMTMSLLAGQTQHLGSGGGTSIRLREAREKNEWFRVEKGGGREGGRMVREETGDGGRRRDEG